VGEFLNHGIDPTSFACVLYTCKLASACKYDAQIYNKDTRHYNIYITLWSQEAASSFRLCYVWSYNLDAGLQGSFFHLVPPLR